MNLPGRTIGNEDDSGNEADNYFFFLRQKVQWRGQAKAELWFVGSAASHKNYTGAGRI